MKRVSAEVCYDGVNVYYCSSGQTCGNYYGDCRGLPTYAIIAIISTSVLLLSLCIRCCIQLNASNARPVPQRVSTSIQNPRHLRVQIYSTANNVVTQPSAIAQVHTLREDLPPSYAVAVSSSTELPKY